MHVWGAVAPEERMQHDSYTCARFPGSIGWPTQRLEGPANFFGAIGGMELHQECPLECRRKGHPEWKFC